MNQLATKVGSVEQDLARDRGPLNLFALLEREDLSDRWDLVVSASWAGQDEATIRYLTDVIKRHLSPGDMTLLSRVVVLDAGQDPVKAINESYQVEHGQLELSDPASFDLPAKHGYVITSRRAA